MKSAPDRWEYLNVESNMWIEFLEDSFKRGEGLVIGGRLVVEYLDTVGMLVQMVNLRGNEKQRLKLKL